MEKTKNIKIMLIDENEQTLKLLKENFASSEFLVIGAKTNGIVALEEIKKERPDVIVMDVVLSGVDGFNLIEKINELNIDTKIIVVSSLSLEGFITKALNYIKSENKKSDITIDDVATHAGFSTDYFNRIFFAHTGFNIMEYVRFSRLKKAAHLLRGTNNDILDIALDCGYEAHESFSRAFI